MTQRLPLSVYIIAKNEADRIGTAIASVKDWVDEVIVIDSGSSDNTLDVSRSLGAKVFTNPWPGYGLQKRFGEDQCRNRWLMNIDADEEVTPQLTHEIQALFATGTPPLAAYALPIRDLLPGEQRLARGGHTNTVLRLYDREKARFSESPVHDSVIVREGNTAILAAPLLHRSFRSLVHAMEKVNSYSSAQAKELQKSGLAWPWLRLVIEFPMAFFKCYLLRGYMRRRGGFSYAMLYAFGRFVRIAKYLEIRDNTKE